MSGLSFGNYSMLWSINVLKHLLWFHYLFNCLKIEAKEALQDIWVSDVVDILMQSFENQKIW